MMTVVTTMRLQSGEGDEWDTLIRRRFRSAQTREGWVSGQLLAGKDSPGSRVIVGTWESREAWEAWHEDPAFLEVRAKLDDLAPDDQDTVWYDVIEDART